MPGLVYRGTYIATLPKGLYIEAYTKLQCPRAYIQRHIQSYNAPGLIYRGTYTLLQCPRATHLQLEVIHRGTVQHQSLVHILVLLAHVDCHHYSEHNHVTDNSRNYGWVWLPFRLRMRGAFLGGAPSHSSPSLSTSRAPNSSYEEKTQQLKAATKHNMTERERLHCQCVVRETALCSKWETHTKTTHKDQVNS